MDFSASLRHIRTIEEYWQARGHTVSCRLEAIPGKGIIEPHYIVRSDMVGGLPKELAVKTIKGNQKWHEAVSEKARDASLAL